MQLPKPRELPCTRIARFGLRPYQAMRSDNPHVPPVECQPLDIRFPTDLDAVRKISGERKSLMVAKLSAAPRLPGRGFSRSRAGCLIARKPRNNRRLERAPIDRRRAFAWAS